MTKSEYIFIRDYAWKILVLSKINSLPVDITLIKSRFYIDEPYQQPNFREFVSLSKVLLQQIGLDSRDENAIALATRIMAPLIVLKECGVSSPTELQNLTLLPQPIAEKRFIRLNAKDQTTGMSPAEREVLKLFLPFCKHYKSTR